MNPRTVKNELYEIGKVYPLLLGLMQKRWGKQPHETVGGSWAVALADLEPGHFESVCYEYATLQRRLPDRLDDLPFEIRTEVRKRMLAEQEAWRVHQEHLDGRRRREEYQRREMCLPIQNYLLDVSDEPEKRKETQCTGRTHTEGTGTSNA